MPTIYPKLEERYVSYVESSENDLLLPSSNAVGFSAILVNVEAGTNGQPLFFENHNKAITYGMEHLLNDYEKLIYQIIGSDSLYMLQLKSGG